jgi:TolB-like protein/tetratricopeptide (TPR) repeat protein/DNA-binding winged helix-turn-helix (wHTH) protein
MEATEATDLQDGFRLGEWLVEPREALLTGPAGPRPLASDQLALLTELALRQGEAVSRRELRERIWPGEAGTDARLRETVHSLREVLGGSPQDQRYIANIARTDLMLVARVAPLAPPVAVPTATLEAGSAPVAPRISSLQTLLAELRRRHVFRVVGAYLVGMWLVLQVAETIFEPLHLPDWWLTALTILVIIGLPIVAVLAWEYEITPDGIVRDDGRGGGLRLPRKRAAVAPAVVAGVALMAMVTGYAWWRSIDHTREPGEADFDPSPQSIGVLPFADMSPSGEPGYLGDGLSEELSSDLAKLPGLRVAARTSAFAYKGRDLDVRRIGRELGVRYVLEGSVRREGERVRVTAQLIDALTGFHAWTESYDRPWQDLIAIQQDISGAIARELQAVLTPEVAQQIRASSTTNPRAYDFYLAGVSQLRKGSAISNIDAAEDLFRRALEEDPGFARAQAGMCEIAIARFDATNATDQVYAAESACRQALETDPSLKETELALGRLYIASGRPEQAEAVYRSLLRRSPRDALVHIGLGRALAKSNRPDEAERSFREAIAVEPGFGQAYNALGAFLFEVARNREAAEAFRRVTELAPGNPTAYNNLGGALLAAGDLQQSATAFERSIQIEPSRGAYSNLGTLYYYLGRFDEAVAAYTKAIALAPEDHRLWGGRGDSRWYLPKGRPAARDDYRRAALLAEKALAVDASDAEAWALLGYFHGRLGDQDRSRRDLARALELGPDLPFVAYCAALAAADRGDRPEAERLIRQAIDNGFARELVRPDPALKGIPIT